MVLDDALFALVDQAGRAYAQGMTEREYGERLPAYERFYEAAQLFAGAGRWYALVADRAHACATAAQEEKNTSATHAGYEEASVAYLRSSKAYTQAYSSLMALAKLMKEENASSSLAVMRCGLQMLAKQAVSARKLGECGQKNLALALTTLSKQLHLSALLRS